MEASRFSIGVAILLLVGPALTGCIGGSGDAVETAATGDARACEHPHPCEDPDAWPANLTGPFDVADPELVHVESFDGTSLEMAIWRPDVPDEVQVPVVLHAQPYAGQCYLAPPLCDPMPDDPSWLEIYGGTPEALVEAGYAFVNMNVRGTGNSGGCFDLNGEDEARDIGHVIDHLANASWSNGRVGMYGLSYMGTTPWLGALQETDALKTIVPGGIVVDEYLFGWTPQGAATVLSSGFNVPYIAGLGVYPPIGGGPQDATTDHVENLPERTCPEVVEAMAEYPSSQFTDDRDEAYFEERRSLTRLDEIDAAVLVAQGLEDQSGHGYQEDYIWPRLTNASKTMVLGQWGHQFPDGEMLDGHPVAEDWETMLVDWMDHWLKGTAPEPALGQVTYQASDGTWHTSEVWPPAEASRQVLHLTGDRMARDPGDTSATFQAVPAPAGAAACTASTPITPGTPPSTHVYTSEPTEAPVTLAGNPAAYLVIDSTEPGGTFTLDLYETAGEDPCQDREWLTAGAVDLRFHDGGFTGEDFPVLEPTPIRVDLMNVADVVEPGHRLQLVLEGPGQALHQGQPWTPQITVHADGTAEASQLALPIVEGDLGGQPPAIDYPPRPIAPGSAS